MIKDTTMANTGTWGCLTVRHRLQLAGLAMVVTLLLFQHTMTNKGPASALLLSLSFVSRPSATFSLEVPSTKQRHLALFSSTTEPSANKSALLQTKEDISALLREQNTSISDVTVKLGSHQRGDFREGLKQSFISNPGAFQILVETNSVQGGDIGCIQNSHDSPTVLASGNVSLTVVTIEEHAGLPEGNSHLLNEKLGQGGVETVNKKGNASLHPGPGAFERSNVNHNSHDEHLRARPLVLKSSETEIVKRTEEVRNSEILFQQNNTTSLRVSSLQTLASGRGVQPSKITPSSKELQLAKEAITNASLESADPNLHAILYKNVSAFSKSYEIMEKVFKVYIYKDGSKPLVHCGPTTGIYASEGQFIESIKRANEHVVKDPAKAHMFFLPYSVQHMVTHLYVPNTHSMLPLATFIKNYVNSLAARYPFWNRTQGADHFYVSCHDWGPAIAQDHPTLRKNVVKVVCNADKSEGFVLGKDASLPEIYLHSLKLPLHLGGPGHNKRPYLAFFAGQMHGRVRPTLIAHWKDKDPDMKIYEVLPKHISRKISYIQHMKSSKFCICAMGFEVNSPRIVEALYSDCVPVIIADNFVLPFSDVLNWDTFSVTVPESDIPNLKTILTGIPERKYQSMQGRLRHVREHFVWHEKPVKYDVFNMILHSVWMSRLQQLDHVVTTSVQ